MKSRLTYPLGGECKPVGSRRRALEDTDSNATEGEAGGGEEGGGTEELLLGGAGGEQ